MVTQRGMWKTARLNVRIGRRHHVDIRRLRCAGVGVVALAMCWTMLAGCSRTMMTRQASTDYSPQDSASDMDFWHSLAERLAVSNDEALHAVIMLQEGEDPTSGYVSRVTFAKKQKWLPDSWQEPAEQAAQRGMIAVAVCRACKVEGGVMMRALGPTPRYALRELVYLGIMADSTETQTVPGIEFLGIISKAKDEMERRSIREAEDREAERAKGR